MTKTIFFCYTHMKEMLINMEFGDQQPLRKQNDFRDL